MGTVSNLFQKMKLFYLGIILLVFCCIQEQCGKYLLVKTKENEKEVGNDYQDDLQPGELRPDVEPMPDYNFTMPSDLQPVELSPDVEPMPQYDQYNHESFIPTQHQYSEQATQNSLPQHSLSPDIEPMPNPDTNP